MIELSGKYNTDCKIFVNEVEAEVITLVCGILDNEISAGVPVRIMPDTHAGKGIVIGFTMPLTRSVNPNYIGVDIGCSVTSYKLNKHFGPSDLPRVDCLIRKVVPMGCDIHKDSQYDHWWVEDYLASATQNVNHFKSEWNKRFGDQKEDICIDRGYISELCEKVDIKESVFYNSVGTLGGGNHFIEVGESLQEGAHYLTLHSGSRNFGLKVCNYHANKMKVRNFFPQEYQDEFECITKNTTPRSDIPAKLAELNARYEENKKEYFLQGEDMYEYLVDMVIAQTYAQFNHRVMAHDIFVELRDVEVIESIHSMHNFIDTRDWIIRKGAIRAYRGEKMVIPFNMRDGLLICEGKSNVGWNCSAPHGAGRILARSQAFKTLKMEEFEKEMKGIYSTSVCPSTLDESPMAYKDKDIIINAIGDTAWIQDTVKPILNIKAKA